LQARLHPTNLEAAYRASIERNSIDVFKAQKRWIDVEEMNQLKEKLNLKGWQILKRVIELSKSRMKPSTIIEVSTQ
jgi:hypothetical protein